MSWRYSVLSRLDPLVTAYQSELDARTSVVRTGSEEQQLEIEIDDLTAILTAMKELAYEADDPQDVLDPMRVKGNVQDDLFVFRRPGIGCKVVYLRDVLAGLAKPIWIYHVSNQKKRLQQLAELLKSGQISNF